MDTHPSNINVLMHNTHITSLSLIFDDNDATLRVQSFPRLDFCHLSTLLSLSLSLCLSGPGDLIGEREKGREREFWMLGENKSTYTEGPI